MKNLSYGILMFFMIATVNQVSGHGDVHKRIKETTKEIKADRDSAYLYLKRGELYIQHGDFKKALRDFTKAEKRGLDDLRLAYNKAEANYLLGKYLNVITLTDIILNRDSQYVKAHRIKGQALMHLELYPEAARSFESVIQLAEHNLPENYFEAAEAWNNSAQEGAYEIATDIIHQGIDDLGPLITFYHVLIQMAKNEDDYTTVIAYHTQVIDLSDRKERAYYERGLSYLDQQKPDQAHADFLLAKKSIDSLNNRLQNQKPIKELLTLIQTQLVSDTFADK